MTGAVAPAVLAAPSGTGKTTLARRLVGDSDRYVFSVSATTRPPREGERDGTDYHFVGRETFEAMVEAGEARGVGRGPWAPLRNASRGGFDAAAARGEHVVLDIDVQGARQIRESVPDARLIFVLPPNVDIMMTRLTGRGTEAPAEIARRLKSALEELRAVGDFEYVVVNDDLERCLAAIREIAERGVGSGPDGHLPDVEAYRSEIGRILDDEYAEYANS